jgi:hypothetical protein
VFDTAQVPASVPVVLSSRISMFPPVLSEATPASKEVAPEPKSTPYTFM